MIEEDILTEREIKEVEALVRKSLLLDERYRGNYLNTLRRHSEIKSVISHNENRVRVVY